MVGKGRGVERPRVMRMTKPSVRRTGSAAVIALAVLVGLLAGCAGRVPADGARVPGLEREAVRRQLRGHLARLRGCHDEALRRDPDASAFVDVDLRIGTDGRVDELRVEGHETAGSAILPCVRSRLVHLYFDPAPRRPARVRRSYAYCAHDDGGVCRLGPVRALRAGAAASEALGRSVAARTDALSACARGAGTTAGAILDLELQVRAGRIMAGRVRRVVPEASPLRGCGVGPLLGTAVEEGAAPADGSYRAVLRLLPTDPPAAVAAR